MTDRAVLAHDVLVLEYDSRPRPVVRAHVRPADEVDDLVGFDSAGTRIDRIGSDAGEVVDLQRRDGAVAFDADPRVHPMVARMDIGDEALQPISNEFHRAAEELGQRDRRHLIRIGMHLDAERAAHVLGQHAYLVLLETEVLGEQVLHHVRRLRALIDREALLARVPVGHDRARLVGHAGVAAEAERGLDDCIGVRKSLIGLDRPRACARR